MSRGMRLSVVIGPLVVTALAGCPSRTSSDGGGGGTGGEDTCPLHPAYQCSAPLECGGLAHPCGPLEEFDERGCLRPQCEADADCGQGQLCYRDPDASGIISECDEKAIPGQCSCLILVGGGCDRGWCVEAVDVPEGSNGLGGDCGWGQDCGDFGTNSHVEGNECVCDPGHEFCTDDPLDFSCCPGDGTCPDPNSFYSNGLCYCNAGYQWCNPGDPDDLSCCRGTGTDGSSSGSSSGNSSGSSSTSGTSTTAGSTGTAGTGP